MNDLYQKGAHTIVTDRPDLAQQFKQQSRINKNIESDAQSAVSITTFFDHVFFNEQLQDRRTTTM